jgi:hypothetical protein
MIRRRLFTIPSFRLIDIAFSFDIFDMIAITPPFISHYWPPPFSPPRHYATPLLIAFHAIATPFHFSADAD